MYVSHTHLHLERVVSWPGHTWSGRLWEFVLCTTICVDIWSNNWEVVLISGGGFVVNFCTSIYTSFDSSTLSYYICTCIHTWSTGILYCTSANAEVRFGVRIWNVSSSGFNYSTLSLEEGCSRENLLLYVLVKKIKQMNIILFSFRFIVFFTFEKFTQGNCSNIKSSNYYFLIEMYYL